MGALMRSMFRNLLLAAFVLTAGAAQAQPQIKTAKNVILFLGDAGGLSTLNAAGIRAHDRPQSLFLHAMPHIGLSDTSALDNWVTDSAAGMSAIVTGHKTRNGMISMVPAEGGGFTAPQTILEMAEARGLSTGIVTNMPIWDATPAATYAHAARRNEREAILKQLFAPRQGDGPDFIVGRDRKTFDQVFAPETQADLLAKHGYQGVQDPAALRPDMPRALAITDAPFDPRHAVEAAIGALSRNDKGYFLMVEWDMHTDDAVEGLTHVVEMDDLIRKVSQLAGKDTLILFVADHSFGLRLRNAPRNQTVAAQMAAQDKDDDARKVIAIDPTHTGEEVVAAAMGPGAEHVRGFFPNTHLFEVMRRAFGWSGEAQTQTR